MDDDGDYSESRALVILDQHAEREKTGPYHERRRVRRRVTAVLMSSSFDRLALVALGASAVSPFVVVVLSEVKDPSPTTPAADCRRRDCIPILGPAALSVLNRDGLVILDAGLPADVIEGPGEAVEIVCPVTHIYQGCLCFFHGTFVEYISFKPVLQSGFDPGKTIIEIIKHALAQATKRR